MLTIYQIFASSGGGSFDLDMKPTAASPSINPCLKGSRVSKNLSELALSVGVTSQVHPTGTSEAGDEVGGVSGVLLERRGQMADAVGLRGVLGVGIGGVRFALVRS